MSVISEVYFLVQSSEIYSTIPPSTIQLYLQWHNNMSEIFFLSIEICALEENRREGSLKTNTDIISFDYLQRIDKIICIETDFVISFYFCRYFCFSRSELCIT